MSRHLARYLRLLRGHRAANAAAVEEVLALHEGRAPVAAGLPPVRCSLGWLGCPYDKLTHDKSAALNATYRGHSKACHKSRLALRNEKEKLRQQTAAGSAERLRHRRNKWSREWRERERDRVAKGEPKRRRSGWETRRNDALRRAK